MAYLTIVILLLLGVLGAASLIVSKKPNAKEAIAKLAPYQGWIGVVGFIWGVWDLIQLITHLGLVTRFPILLITMIAVVVCEIFLGFLLGLGVMKTFIKSPDAQAKLDDRAARMAPKQGFFGLLSLGVGVWLLLVTLFKIGVPG